MATEFCVGMGGLISLDVSVKTSSEPVRNRADNGGFKEYNIVAADNISSKHRRSAMGFFSRLSKPKFDDARIVSVATRAIEQDPTIENPGQLVVTSKNGVVTVSGPVSTDLQMNHVAGTVNSALKTAGLQHAEIVNQVVVGR